MSGVAQFLADYAEVLERELEFLKEDEGAPREAEEWQTVISLAGSLTHDPVKRMKQFIKALEQWRDKGKINEPALRDGLRVVSGIVFEANESLDALAQMRSPVEMERIYRFQYDIPEAQKLTPKQMAEVTQHSEEADEEYRLVKEDMPQLYEMQEDLTLLLRTIGVQPQLDDEGSPAGVGV